MIVGVEVAVEAILLDADSSIDPKSTGPGTITGPVLTTNCLGRCQTVPLGVFTGRGVSTGATAIANPAVTTIILSVGAGVIILTGARIG